MELSDLYSGKILEIAANAPSAPRLPEPDASARRTSRVCGSVIDVDIDVANGVVVAYGHHVAACALGQTSAAIVARNAIGSTVGELREVRARMRAMLTEGGPPPTGRWADLRYLEPVREYRARHDSTMLVFEAVVAALDSLEQKSGLPGLAAVGS